jgi:hypothetical protein
MHPEVRKALDEAAAVRKAQGEEIEALKKSLEMKELEAGLAKYEAIGKKAGELAQKLYELKKAGGTVYADYVAVLDEQLALVEKSGLFGEVGSGFGGSPGPGSGGELDAKAAEIRKANPTMTAPEAFAKAYEENPGLAAKYDAEYLGRAG